MQFLTTFLSLVAACSAASSFSVVDGAPALTFKYETDMVNSKNWIGIYQTSGGGPEVNGTKGSSNSLTYSYAPDASGTVKVDVSSLASGKYKAFYLYNDKYTWLADPIEVYRPGEGGVSFYVDKFTTLNGRVGDKFNATISGLVNNAPDADSKFSKVDGKSSKWVNVSPDGVISGTPRKNSPAVFNVKVTGTDGSTASLLVVIPVKGRKRPLVTNYKVMTSNLWHAGNIVNDGTHKQVEYMTQVNADLIGLQETEGYQAKVLADILGWFSWQSHDASIISRYPIVEVYPELSASGSVRIALDGDDSQIIHHNAHLGYTPYGPYDFCYDHRTKDEVYANEKRSGRTPQIIEITEQMKSLGELSNAKNVPVLLTGDFNAPSQLDWTEANKAAHCNVTFEWPTSKYPLEAGLTDSYRELHPNPVKTPGDTWSPIYLIDTDYNNQPEPMDRLDFVYYAGGLKPISSETQFAGNNKPEPNEKDNDWSSDHKWVLTEFKVLK